MKLQRAFMVEYLRENGKPYARRRFVGEWGLPRAWPFIFRTRRNAEACASGPRHRVIDLIETGSDK